MGKFSPAQIAVSFWGHWHSGKSLALTPPFFKMASSYIVPRPGQILTWGTPRRDSIEDLNNRGFEETIKDKSIFYLYSAPLWDKASEKSYQLLDDIAIIKKHAGQIASMIDKNSIVLEYGPGASGKVLPITSRMDKSCTYVGIDMHRPFLEQTMEQVARTSRGRIGASGIETDFVGFPEIISKIQGPKFIVSFGSNLFNHPNPIEQLQPIAENMSAGDKIYLSIDCHRKTHSDKIKATYECDEFVTFIKDALSKVEGYNPHQWQIDSKLHEEYIYRHSFVIKAKEDVSIRGKQYQMGEEIEFFPCYKSSKEIVRSVCAELGLTVQPVFESSATKMSHFLIEKPKEL